MSAPRGIPRRPQAVLFDLGNTLIREEHFDKRSGTERVLELAHNPRGLSAAEVCALVEELDADLEPRRESSHLEISPFSVHRLVYEPHGIRFDCPFEEIELAFWKGATRFSLTPGVHELLVRLRDEGLPLAVVSNAAFTSRILSWQVSASGLGEFFRFVMSSGDYVVRKPHPAIFRTAARKLGVDPANTWFAGDSLRFDVAGANEAGMVSVWYNPKDLARDGVAPDVEVRSWSDLEVILLESL